MNARHQAEIAASYARAEFGIACESIRRCNPTHAELTKLLECVESAVLSFHENAGFEGSGSIVDSVKDAQEALDLCYHHSTRSFT